MPNTPTTTPTETDAPAGTGGYCKHCGRAFIRRFSGQKYCRRPVCLKVESRQFAPFYLTDVKRGLKEKHV